MKQPWKISLHGGHNNLACDHAHSGIDALIEAAVAFGYRTFGFTEHAPRVEPERLYDEELAMGWTVDSLQARFAAYALQLDDVIPRYADRIEVLKGFEAEVVPIGPYAEVMNGFRERLGFEYMVASVHWVDGEIIDYTPERFARAVEAQGGLEALAIRYYETVAEMALALRPELIGHLDLVRKYAPDEASVSTPGIREAAHAALEAIRECDAILDVNTAGYAKGLGRPYPAPWLVEAAKEIGIPFCFGDDSHSAAQVGEGIEAGRDYLLALGVDAITVLRRGQHGLNRETVLLSQGKI